MDRKFYNGIYNFLRILVLNVVIADCIDKRIVLLRKS